MIINVHLPLLQLEHDPVEHLHLIVQDDHVNITVSQEVDGFQQSCSLDNLPSTLLSLGIDTSDNFMQTLTICQIVL